MSKTIRISIYVIVLLLGYFSVTTVFDSCKSKSSENHVQQDNDTTSSEEDDFFEDFDESSDEDNDYTTHSTTDDSDEINYDDLDRKLKGNNTSRQHTTDRSSDNDEEKPMVNHTPKPKKKSKTTTSKPRNYSSNGSGKYMVVAGNFLVETNANLLVNKLRNLGYTNAEVSVFDMSKYYTVIAYRNSKKSEASRVVNNLKKKRIDCYVHTRQE